MSKLMQIEIDPLDTEPVVVEAAEFDRNPEGARGTALAAYFSMLGNYPDIDAKKQVEMTRRYRQHVRRCVEVLDEIPGSIQFLTRGLEGILKGERLEAFIQYEPDLNPDRNEEEQKGKELTKCDYFDKLQKNGALNTHSLKAWSVRPNLVMQWSREMLETQRKIGPRPWLTKMGERTERPRQELEQWYQGVEALEQQIQMPINKAFFYLHQLRAHAEEAESIFNTLVECNLKLVIAVAKKYQNRGLSMEDLIQEGNLGLMKGIEKFQPEKGYNLSTYAVLWIKQSICKALHDQGCVIRFPVYVQQLLQKIQQVQTDWQREHRVEATTEQIATVLKTSEKNVRNALSCRQIYSLQQTVRGGEDELSLEQVIVGCDGLALDESDEQREALGMLLKSLNPQEKKVITLRFGLSTGYAQTLKEIGQAMRVTKERIRQIETQALTKLRSKKAKDIREV